MTTPAAAAAFADMITIGVVVKPQGRKGEVLVEPLSDRPDRFPGLAQAWIGPASGPGRQIRVASCWPHKGRFVLKLDGVDSIDDAERLRGQELRLDSAEIGPLPEGRYYHHELRGLVAIDPAGRSLGQVADILETGAGAPVIVIRGGGEELLVPFVDEFVTKVDVAAGRVHVTPPEMVEC